MLMHLALARDGKNSWQRWARIIGAPGVTTRRCGSLKARCCVQEQNLIQLT